MLGIPQESGKSGPIKARYIIRVLRSVEGHIIDARDSDYGHDWNIGLYDIMSATSTKKVEKHGQMLWKCRSVLGKVSYGYCLFCSYASTNHRTLNNHIRMHLRLSLACRMPDCWFITHSAESMWKHAATHKLQTCVQEEIDTGTIFLPVSFLLSCRFIQNWWLRLPLVNRMSLKTHKEF